VEWNGNKLHVIDWFYLHIVFGTKSWLKPDVLLFQRATLCTRQTIMIAMEVFLLLVDNLLFHVIWKLRTTIACKIKLQNNGSLIVCSAYHLPSSSVDYLNQHPNSAIWLSVSLTLIGKIIVLMDISTL